MTLSRASCLALLVVCGCRAGGEAGGGAASAAGDSAPPSSYTLPARPLRLGRVPHLRVEATRAESEPLVAHLSARFSHPFELVVPDTYDKAVEAMVAGGLDVAVLSPLAYVLAKHRMPELRMLAQLVAEGGSEYLGYIVVPVASPRRSLAELRGARFAFVDPRSASGYLMAVDLLLRAGLDPQRDFASTVFAGSHPDVVDALLADKADAGAIASTTFSHMRNDDVGRRLRILAKSEPIPFDAVVASPALPQGFVAELEQLFLALSSRTAEGRAALAHQRLSNGFVPGDDAAYARVRAAARELGLLR